MDGDHGERDPRHGGLRPTLLPSSQSQRGNNTETTEDFDQPFYQNLKVKEVTMQKLWRTSTNLLPSSQRQRGNNTETMEDFDNPSIKFSKSKR